MIDVDLCNVVNGNNFYERKNNLAKIMCKNYCYLNDIMIQIIAEMLNIVIVVEINYLKINKKNEINYEYFGVKNNVWIDAIICLRLKCHENDNLNHFQAMKFAFDNANNRKGRLRVRERVYDLFNTYPNHILNIPESSEQKPYFKQK